MGRPKALLECASGTPLAIQQARKIMDAGASDVLIVLGCDADRIIPRLEDPVIRIAFNPEWKLGRVSSLQTGIRSVGQVQGAVILPVDTVGVQTSSLARLIALADQSSALAIRPTWQGRPGRILWLSHALFDDILGIHSDPSLRFDEWIKGKEHFIDVDDPAIMNNVNTPEEWKNIACN